MWRKEGENTSTNFLRNYIIRRTPEFGSIFDVHTNDARMCDQCRVSNYREKTEEKHPAQSRPIPCHVSYLATSPNSLPHDTVTVTVKKQSNHVVYRTQDPLYF